MMIFNKFFNFFFVHFDGYYIVRSDEGQPRSKYIFNKCGTNIYFFTLQRFGPSPSPNFKLVGKLDFFNRMFCLCSCFSYVWWWWGWRKDEQDPTLDWVAPRSMGGQERVEHAKEKNMSLTWIRYFTSLR